MSKHKVCFSGDIRKIPHVSGAVYSYRTIFDKLFSSKSIDILFFLQKYICGTHQKLLTKYMQYGKCRKILNTLLHTFLAEILLFMQFFPKILSRIENRVDLDQTAPSGAV